MKAIVLVILFLESILFLNSCSEEDPIETKPEFIYAKTYGTPDMERTIELGNSVNLEILYGIDNQDYSFNKLICEKLGSNSSYKEQFLFKVEFFEIL